MIYNLEGKNIMFSLVHKLLDRGDFKGKCLFVSDKFVVIAFHESLDKPLWIPIDNFVFIMED